MSFSITNNTTLKICIFLFLSNDIKKKTFSTMFLALAATPVVFSDDSFPL